ncbi:NAD(P)/FAD-dependent oxidoreductase [Roseibium sp.]|uniref:NAD(P)/FAD-dependent oxidoreductase n=1 Tax=Roseibium sp. TaxID=1936156 RepID=UPI003296C885
MIFDIEVGFPDHLSVVIVGPGPAGIGVARVLRDLAIPDVWVFERGQIGQSFRNWPKETRLLTHSFPRNVFGVADLNAVSFDSSPGWSLRSEHPSGEAYAQYLEQAAELFGVNVQCGLDVFAIEPIENGFTLQTSRGTVTADYVIWACGLFGAPIDAGLPGGRLGRHYGAVNSWDDVEEDEVYVIGGYESGIDAAIGLSQKGKDVNVLSRGAPWLDRDKDPSRSLSPYTQQRLDTFRKCFSINLLSDVDVIALEQEGSRVHTLGGDGRSWLSDGPPILATGFLGGTKLVSQWFDHDQDGIPLLTAQDESTAVPGLFLVEPEVSHQGHLFCFIYKFRQRFAVVARAIAARIGADTSVLEMYYENNMFLDDLACCDDDKCLR